MRVILIKTTLVIVSFFPLLSTAQPGAIDTHFGNSGWVNYNEAETLTDIFSKIMVLPSGKFLVQKGDEIGKYNADGTPDLTFGTNSSGWKKMETGFKDFVILPSGDFLATAGSRVVKYNGISGVIDETFGNNGVVTLEVTGISLAFLSITLDTKGRIVLGGAATYGVFPNSVTNPMVARLNADGSLDTEFNGGGIRILVFLTDIYRVIIKCITDENDKIIAGVDVGSAYDKDDIILKFNSNGKLDLSFGGGDGEYEMEKDLVDIAAYKDGTIAYTTRGNEAQLLRPNIVSLTVDGTQRFSFTMNNSRNFGAIAFQDDGKIIAAGSGNSPYTVLTERIGVDGKRDGSYGNGGGTSFDNDSFTGSYNMIFHNKRIFIVGADNMVNINVNGIPQIASGFILALDGTGVRLKCNNFQAGDLTPTADPGKCYKTINNSRFDPTFIPATATGTVQYQIKRNGSIVEQGTGSVNGKDFQVGQTQVIYTYTDVTSQSCTFAVNVFDKEAPIAKTKNITVQLNAAGIGTITAADVDNASTDACGIQSMLLDKTSFDCSNVGANTVTLTVKDAGNNTSSATATVTVEDKVAPEAKCKNVTIYLDAAGKASITTSQINDGSADACGIKSLSLSKTEFDCSNKGTNTVILTVTDINDNSSTCSATVTVLDKMTPVITSVTPNPAFLWPSDRKMKNVVINTLFTDNCPGTTWKITNVVIKQGEFAGDNVNPDWEITGDNTVNLRAEIPKKGARRVYTITVTCTDAAGNTSAASTDVVVAHSITSPSSGFTVQAGTTVNLTGEFWDKPGNQHTAKWLIDDKIVNGTITEPSDLNIGKVTGTYKFANAGVYKLRMNVTDQTGVITYANTYENLDAVIVVYDPNGGYTYGGGYFNSPIGALLSDLNTSGEASYGFTINYYKNATLPKGETQFEFKVGSFEFNALNFDYLVISNSMAQFKGTGKIIGGQSGVGFTMTVTDGQLDGTGIDKIRMKIYNKNNGRIIYDNQPGASEAALPTQAVAANSTIVIGGGVKQSSFTNSEIPVVSLEPNVFTGNLEAGAFPNPHKGTFSLSVQSPKAGKMTIEYFTVTGARVHIVEQQVKAHEQFLIPNTGMKFNGTIFYKISIDGMIKTGKVIGIK